MSVAHMLIVAIVTRNAVLGPLDDTTAETVRAAARIRAAPYVLRSDGW